MRTLMYTTIGFLIALSSATAAETRDKTKWLSYEPAVVELQGRLKVVPKYGPPNFGENPETDLKVEIPVIELAQPVNVRRDPKSDLNSKSFEQLKELQLVFSLRAQSYSDLIGQEVVVTGTLLQAHTAHHYTEVLLTVREIHRVD